MKKYLLLLLSVLFTYCSSDKQQVLVAVDNSTITVDEFKDRISFNPLLKSTIPPASFKKDVLQSLIVEKLLAKKITQEQKKTLLGFVNRKSKEAAIEQLWSAVILKDLAVDDSTLWNYYNRTLRKRIISFAVFNNKYTANLFFNEWFNGEEKVKQTLSIDTLTYEGKIPLLEQAVFKAPSRTIQQPVLIGKKYFVFKVEQELIISPASRSEYARKERSLKKSYFAEKKWQLFQNWVTKSHLSYKLEKEVFKDLVFTISKELRFTSEQPKLQMRPNSKLQEAAPKQTKNVVIFSDGTKWDTQRLLAELKEAPYPLSFESEKNFKFSIIKAVKRLLDDELLYMHAKKLDLDKSEAVVWQTKMWKDWVWSEHVLLKSRKNAEAWHTELKDLVNNSSIEINDAVLDTVYISPTNMTVLKSHFPGQVFTAPVRLWNVKALFIPSK